MMIARWHFDAKFGHKAEAIQLGKEWAEQIGRQTNLDMDKVRYATGSVGARESHVEMELQINGLAELDDFFKTIASIQMHQEWGKRMSEVIVSGSTYWEVMRVID